MAPNPGFTFLPEFLIARVSPPDAVGTLQFFDGNTKLGTPVPVIGGFAWSITPLTAGPHSLIAVYLSTNLGIEGCAGGAGFFGGPTPLPCVPSGGFEPSGSSPVSVTVNSLF